MRYKYLEKGYGKICIGLWKIDIDNDEIMLRCPFCQCRVTWRYYKLAIGNHGISYCPYCGKDLRVSAQFEQIKLKLK